MKTLRGWVLCLAGFPLCGGTIDASRAATILLDPGESLAFAIPIGNYRMHAATYGLAATPSGVSFTLMSAASLVPASLAADLESADGSYAVALGQPLSFEPGYLSSAAYTGPVSTLEGAFSLTAAASQQIFGEGTAELVLRNIGASILLGLPPNSLPQDLFVSLSDGPLAVGALRGSVLLEEPLNEVPEPPSGGPLIAAGIALCLIGRPGGLLHAKMRDLRLLSTPGLWYHLGGSFGILPLCRKIQPTE